MSGRKSPQKGPIWRRIGNVRFAETGWWAHQGSPHVSFTGKNQARLDAYRIGTLDALSYAVRAQVLSPFSFVNSGFDTITSDTRNRPFRH